jgi:flavin-dependent dehydrogenase
MKTVAIVGGGPAGLAVAIAARVRGLRAVVFEKQQPLIDKACGEGLMPGGVDALARLGVAIPEQASMPFYGLQLVTDTLRGPLTVAAPFGAGQHGLGIRRTVLHRALVQRAESLGADLRWGVAGVALDQGKLITTEGTLDADWIVGADGLHSRVRRWIDAAEPGSSHKRYGLRRHYRITPWTTHVEVHWARGVDAYCTPVARDVVGVALLCDGESPDYDALLARFPALQRRLADAEIVSELRGAGPFRQKTRTVFHERVALVGDASGYVDPITGEGLSLAFRQAEAAVDAMVRGDLRHYARAHKKIVRMPTMFTLGTLAVHGSPWRQRMTLRLLRAAPMLLTILIERGLPR